MKSFLIIYIYLILLSGSAFSENNIDEEFLLNLELFESYNFIKEESPQNIYEEDLDVFFASDKSKSPKNEVHND